MVPCTLRDWTCSVELQKPLFGAELLKKDEEKVIVEFFIIFVQVDEFDKIEFYKK